MQYFSINRQHWGINISEFFKITVVILYLVTEKDILSLRYIFFKIIQVKVLARDRKLRRKSYLRLRWLDSPDQENGFYFRGYVLYYSTHIISILDIFRDIPCKYNIVCVKYIAKCVALISYFGRGFHDTILSPTGFFAPMMFGWKL